MRSTESGSETDVILVQPLKADAPTDVTVSGISSVIIPVQPSKK